MPGTNRNGGAQYAEATGNVWHYASEGDVAEVKLSEMLTKHIY